MSSRTLSGKDTKFLIDVQEELYRDFHPEANGSRTWDSLTQFAVSAYAKAIDNASVTWNESNTNLNLDYCYTVLSNEDEIESHQKEVDLHLPIIRRAIPNDHYLINHNIDILNTTQDATQRSSYVSDRQEWRELKRLFVVSGRHWFGCLFPEKGDGVL